MWDENVLDRWNGDRRWGGRFMMIPADLAGRASRLYIKIACEYDSTGNGIPGSIGRQREFKRGYRF
jgi:hypothetical protein